MKSKSQKKLKSIIEFLAKYSGGVSRAEALSGAVDYDFNEERRFIDQCVSGELIKTTGDKEYFQEKDLR